MKATNPPRLVFLVGFMGAGKTSVGQAIAARLGWRFVDLDDLIRQRDPRPISQIFDESGEARFRRLETETLRAFLAPGADLDRVVVALGGGAFVQEENAAVVQATGAPVVFLDAGVEELRRRCADAGEARPLYRDANRFRQLYEQRRGRYMAAELRVDTESKDVEQVAAEVIARLRLEPGVSPRQEAQ